MRITYDPRADALYVELRAADGIRTVEIEDGANADLDENGQIVGLEVLGARKKLGGSVPDSVQIELLQGAPARTPAG